jgi:tRNA A37 threonylcarbamoyladenosine synthetase subunit TsaC/SUA5/YrdC
LLSELGQPILSATFIPPSQSEPIHDPQEIADGHYPGLDLLVDAGTCSNDATTVLRLDEDGTIELQRKGAGALDVLGLTDDA